MYLLPLRIKAITRPYKTVLFSRTVQMQSMEFLKNKKVDVLGVEPRST